MPRAGPERAALGPVRAATARATGGQTPGTGRSSTGTGGGSPPTIGWATPVPGGPSGTGTAATVTVNASNTVGTIGPDFTGFSYEKTHLMNGSLTSNNTSLIAPLQAARHALDAHWSQ